MIMLTQDDVTEIYRIRLHLERMASIERMLPQTLFLPRKQIQSLTHHSNEVARLCGVSPKTVRDIWCGRTHRHITLRLRAEVDDPFCCDWLEAQRFF